MEMHLVEGKENRMCFLDKEGYKGPFFFFCKKEKGK